jgi:hypothetical protein
MQLSSSTAKNAACFFLPYLIVHKCFNQLYSLERTKQARLVPVNIGTSKRNVNVCTAAYYIDVLNLVTEYIMNGSRRLEAAA